MTINTLHPGRMAPDDHHLRPLITYSSPSRTIEVSILVASEEATAGSVIKKAERISPFIKGFNHCSCCAGVPYLANTSMFPVSGAEQLNTSEAILERPINSAKGAYSRFVKPELKAP